jgi:hypothetical protein
MALTSAERFVHLTLAEVINDLGEAKTCREAEQEMASRFNKFDKRSGDRFQVLDAVEARKIRENAVEADGWVEPRNALRRKVAKGHQVRRRAQIESLVGARDHLLRGIAREDRDVIPGKEERVFAGPAVEFENVVFGMEGLQKHLPDSIALGTANE